MSRIPVALLFICSFTTQIALAMPTSQSPENESSSKKRQKLENNPEYDDDSSAARIRIVPLNLPEEPISPTVVTRPDMIFNLTDTDYPEPLETVPVTPPSMGSQRRSSDRLRQRQFQALENLQAQHRASQLQTPRHEIKLTPVKPPVELLELTPDHGKHVRTSNQKRKRYHGHPGASHRESSQFEYENAPTGTLYGLSGSEDHLRTTIRPVQAFSKQERTQILIYNLLRNQGRLISDYHVRINRKIHKCLQRDGLTEEQYYLRLPADLAKKKFRQYRKYLESIGKSKRRLLQLEYRLSQSTYKTVLDWVRDPLNNDPGNEVAHVDHIIPKSRGGSNDLRNAAVCSATLNIQKSDLMPTRLFDYLENPDNRRDFLTLSSPRNLDRAFAESLPEGNAENGNSRDWASPDSLSSLESNGTEFESMPLI